jgi:phosphoribosyl-ATP pyrophosphohydrolase/phosphoribosyl-AMP cyclohydrolase/histidinol dehydrogenase
MDSTQEYRCPVYSTSSIDAAKRAELLERPVKSSKDILELVSPILQSVREGGDDGLRSCVVKFDRCVPAEDASFPLTLQAPFADELAKIAPQVKEAIDVAYRNIKVRKTPVSVTSAALTGTRSQAFHGAQMERESEPIRVETMPGVVCQRFARPIGSVGLYMCVSVPPVRRRFG